MNTPSDTPDARRSRLAASFVPPSLRRRFAEEPDTEPDVRFHWKQAALLWIDIVGFTTLSNRLIKQGPRGIETLSRILRDHFDPLLRAVNDHGGEALFFAGDGLLCGWPCDEGTLRDAIADALAGGAAAVACPPVNDEMGAPVNARYVVACGVCHLAETGGIGGRWMVTPFGGAINDLRAATHPWEPERLIVSPAVLAAAGDLLESEPAGHGCALYLRSIHPVTREPSPDAPVLRSWEALKGYVPEPVAVRLQSEHLEWLAELRRVTAVFVRMPGVAEGDAAMLQQMHEAVQNAQLVTRRHDGILNQFWVDEKAANFLICLGPPPVAHVDDPARGVALALELHQALTKSGHVCSIGVATGHAYCGILGNDLRRHYTVIGDAVNVAARLMALADDGVRCEDATVKGTRQEFVFTPMGEFQLKGVDAPVAVWTAQSGGRGGARARRPIVGRSKELAQLSDGMKKCSQPGITHTVIIEGESGLGKSRLLADFRARAAAMGNRVLAGSGSRVESGIPYHAWRSVFSTLLGIDGVLTGDAQQRTVIKTLGTDLQQQASLLNALLPVNFPDDPSITALSGKQRADATHHLLLTLLRRTAATRPVAVMIDDAQWMDDASWHLAAEVARGVPGVFLICSMHPAEHEEILEALLQAGAERIRLGGLSDHDQDELIRSMIGATEVPEKITELIRNRARGHPFLCMELAQSLVEEGFVHIENGVCRLAPNVRLDEVPLPDTAQSAVMRRIDRLDPGPALALKVASVAGLRFPTRLIENVCPVAQERDHVADDLAIDARLGIIFPDTVEGTEGYEFNHSITRDVAYELMLFEQRRRLHSDIAKWIENHWKGNLATHYTALAHHWEHAEEVLRALDYLEKQATLVFSNGFAKQSVEIGLRGAAMLGLRLPVKPDEIRRDIGAQIGAVMQLLAGRAPSALLDLPRLEDEKMERLLWLLVRIAPFAFQSQQIELYALIAVTCLRFTLEKGSCSATPDVYSMYSVVHRGITGSRVEGCAWSQLALDLDARNGGQMRSRVAFVHGWFHNHWVHPLHDSPALALEAAESGLGGGDVLFACFNLSACVIYQAAAGRPLAEVMSTARLHLDRNSKRVSNAAFHLVHELQVAKALAGLTHDPLTLTDSEYDEDKDIAAICRTEFGNQIGYYLVSRVKLHAHFGDWWGALAWGERARPLRPAFEGQIAEIDLVQFHALAAINAAAESDAVAAAPLLEEARQSAETMRQWAQLCPANFAHKAALIDAMLDDDATEKFDRAAQSAIDAGFIHDAVLAREHQARWERRKNGSAAAALAQALEHCRQWGAEGKAKYLEHEFAAV